MLSILELQPVEKKKSRSYCSSCQPNDFVFIDPWICVLFFKQVLSFLQTIVFLTIFNVNHVQFSLRAAIYDVIYHTESMNYFLFPLQGSE